MSLLICIQALGIPLFNHAEHAELPEINMGMGSERALTSWISLGGQGFDTAWAYGSQQAALGQVISRSGRNRSDFYITTKIPCCPGFGDFGENVVGVGTCYYVKKQSLNASELIEQDLRRLSLEYIDLLLLHWPCRNLEDTITAYKAMEPFVFIGRVRALGVSNFNRTILQSFLPFISVQPYANQCPFSVASHAVPQFGGDLQTLRFCQEKGIRYSAYSPLAGFWPVTHGWSTSALLSDPTVTQIARKYNASSAQVALRWLTQQRIAVVTASYSGNPRHLKDALTAHRTLLSSDDTDRLAHVSSKVSEMSRIHERRFSGWYSLTVVLALISARTCRSSFYGRIV